MRPRRGMSPRAGAFSGVEPGASRGHAQDVRNGTPRRTGTGPFRPPGPRRCRLSSRSALGYLMMGIGRRQGYVMLRGQPAQPGSDWPEPKRPGVEGRVCTPRPSTTV
jgi:hypothetical protein